MQRLKRRTMELARRRVVSGLLGVVLTGTSPLRAMRAKGMERRTTVSHPPFELQAGKDALVALTGDITGFHVDASGKRVSGVWLRDAQGKHWLLGVDQRSLRFKFEVFALAIEELETIRARWRTWKPPELPAEWPEPLRRLSSTRPPEPAAPCSFDPWPFRTARIDVLRRAEFIVEDVQVEETFGYHPNFQSAAAPDRVPEEASAACEVAVGLLFTGEDDGRLLIGVDWAPFALVFTRENEAIQKYLAPCQRVALSDYVARV